MGNEPLMDSHPSDRGPAISGEPGTSSAVLALEADQFFLVYQPEFDLRTNAFVGVEALIRWRHPERGELAPRDFLPALEADGGIVPVGRWTLLTACLQGSEWHDKGYRFSVSVNISIPQAARQEFFTEVEAALTTTRFPAALLVLEFSQAVLHAGAPFVKRLVELRVLGVRIAIDDFEPDHSSIIDLEGLPVDIVKLDRDFINDATRVPSAQLINAVVDQAKVQHIQVVAAGVEDADQSELLRIGNVGVGQGFHFSRPREAAEIDQMLLDFSIFSGKPI